MNNFQIQSYYQNELRLNRVYSRDNLTTTTTTTTKTTKDGAYVINLDEYSDTWTHWIPSYGLNYSVTYFEIFGVEYISIVIKKFIGHKNIQASIFRIQAYGSVMCGYFCIGFINFKLKKKA